MFWNLFYLFIQKIFNQKKSYIFIRAVIPSKRFIKGSNLKACVCSSIFKAASRNVKNMDELALLKENLEFLHWSKFASKSTCMIILWGQHIQKLNHNINKNITVAHHNFLIPLSWFSNFISNECGKICQIQIFISTIFHRIQKILFFDFELKLSNRIRKEMMKSFLNNIFSFKFFS